ncbi:MAG: putative Methyltransferase FkbM family [Verrucomicrobiales bacterium]|nr:putative Methyltransferase FkbM family [Verrucomicrobiales bacterium]
MGKLANRLVKGMKSVGRLPEIAQCLKKCGSPVSVILGYLQLAKPPRQVVYKTKYRLDLQDWADLTTAWVVFLGSEYRIFPSDRTIVDFGANIGAFAILAADENTQATIVCVEPFPANFDRLNATIAQNQLGDRVRTRACALAGSDRIVSFDSSTDIPSHSRKIADEGPPVDNVTRIQAYSLESFMRMEGLETIDFLKMDIEGAEYEALLGAGPDTLKKVKRIGLEYHRDGHESLTEHLQKSGFAITYHPKKGRSGVIEYTRQA